MAATFFLSQQSMLDGSGDPISGALLYTYAESTTTPLAAYSDEALTTAHTNPIVADANGRFGNIYLQALAYKFVLKSAAGVTIWTMDNFNPDGGTVTLAAVPDSVFSVVDDGDTSKAGKFQISGVTTGNTRTITWPDFDGTMATVAGTETLTNKTFSLASNTLTGTTAQFNTALSDGSFATLAGTQTLTNKALTSPVLNGTLSGTAFLDEDDMASDSAIAAASQQSIKAYIDTYARLRLASLAALTALTKASLTDGDIAYISAHTSAGDVGGGYFQWDASSAATVFSGIVVASDEGGTGRWSRVLDGWVTPEMAGGTDRAAIQVAIDYAEATTGVGVMLLGAYTCDTTAITVTAAITIAGIDPERSIITRSTITTNDLITNTSAGATFRNFALRQSSTASDPTNGSAINCDNVARPRVENVTIRGRFYYGIRFEECQDPYCTDCYISGVKNRGIYFYLDTYAFSCVGCNVSGYKDDDGVTKYTSYGIQVNSGATSAPADHVTKFGTISACTAEGCSAYGIGLADACNFINVVGCTSRDNTSYNFYVTEVASPALLAKNINITGCMSSGAGTYGLYINGGQFINVSNFQTDGDTSFAARLLKVTDSHFINCHFLNSSSHGCYVDGASNHLSFTNCLADGNTGRGFYLLGTVSDITFANCRGNNNTVYGFDFASGVTNAHMTGCYAESNTSIGVLWSGVTYSSIDGLVSRNNGGTGLQLQSTCTNIALDNMVLRDNTGYGFYLNGASTTDVRVGKWYAEGNSTAAFLSTATNVRGLYSKVNFSSTATLLDASSASGMWRIHLRDIAATANHAYAVILGNGTTPVIASGAVNAGDLSIAVSGTDIQASHSGGGSVDIHYLVEEISS
jgi:parallel beta helix pectate lyase-like protein